MSEILIWVFYLLSFLSLYVQIYFLVVFLERRKDIIVRRQPIKLNNYPAVTITVPAYNEGSSVTKTVDSLLALDYPKEKLFLILVDDGSTDNTFEFMQAYESNPQIKIFKKANGGKFSAQNLGLEHCTTGFVGCLDSDSLVHPEALKRIMTYFLNQEVMAVAPTIVTWQAKNIVQKAQKIDYELQIYVKKMLSFVNAIHVTPGPFSIFRIEVFNKLGPYKHAHVTEDQEIALRMQTAGMKIEHAPDAYVYTMAPKTIRGLYLQRTRWIYGFLRNAIDYKHLFFKKKYGNIGFLTLPSGFVSVLGVMFLFVFVGSRFVQYLHNKSLEISATGLSFDVNSFSFDPFFINTSTILFVSVFVYSSVLFSLYMGHKILHGKSKFSLDIFLFFIVYSLVAPFWLLKAVWNAVRKYESSWTAEIDSR
ncbi:hypothetical protein A3J61_01800 [Candidatus Nomurabacteria bacterium RIFCSPHIGHO2_02_FULL_38_15]|uniref:Glycosyltransferase 2-like domain-containing protein n=1 Tax=Candidatus Nomurabacteria bacterium RIFCSPHIGHO2_02_FULL_38_15 TaxID=1801752 RepID=A0A1F6VQX0_9BACT|nr:MAG: hypothetical protein A3J61_01800 [Candidatus Nomurabacteria bacterium RIFCSPHIGHO2_02_FULL_38_15]